MCQYYSTGDNTNVSILSESRVCKSVIIIHVTCVRKYLLLGLQVDIIDKKGRLVSLVVFPLGPVLHLGLIWQKGT